MKCGGRFQEIRKPEILLMRVSAIQQAFREVADSLALRDQLNAQQTLVHPLDEHYPLAKNGYDAGITSNGHY
jgi:outer membrane protein TolC